MSLDSDSLELLLLDEDAGALSPEASQLLEIYLQHDTEAARHAGEFRQTLASARMAYAAKPASPLPVPKFIKPAGASPRRNTRLRLPAWAAMAACLVAGYFAGRLWTVRPGVLQETAQTPAVTIAAQSAQPILQRQNPASFWSVQNWQIRANETSRRGGFSLEWESPVKKPRIKINS